MVLVSEYKWQTTALPCTTFQGFGVDREVEQAVQQYIIHVQRAVWFMPTTDGAQVR